MKINELLTKIQKLASSAPEPKPLCFIIVGDKCDECDFCPDCAKEEVSRLKSKGQEEVSFMQEDGALDSDSPRMCDGCNCDLSIALTNYGIASELEHFEVYPPLTPDEWRDFQKVCEAFEDLVGWCDDKKLRERFLKLAGSLKELK